MPSEISLIEELVDRLVGIAETDEEIKKRKPKQPSFRYLTDKNEIKAILEEEDKNISVMKSATQPKIVEDFMVITGLGDVETIENVLKRHQASHKFKN